MLYWTLDTADDAGAVAVDKSGQNENGTIIGSPAQVPGKLNQALSFNGSTQYISSPALSPTEFYNSVSVAAWIKTTNNSRYEAILSKYSASGSGAGYLFRTDPNGNLEMLLGGADISFGSSTAVDTTKINDGFWHHVAAVITIGQDVKFYVDGNFSSATVIHSLANGDAAANLTLAWNAFVAFGNPFTGSLDEVQVYNRALASTEVNAVYQISGGIPDTTPPTVSLTAPAAETVFGNVAITTTAADNIAISRRSVQSRWEQHRFGGDGASLLHHMGFDGGYQWFAYDHRSCVRHVC